jgi:AraC-like DNA-binding protein
MRGTFLDMMMPSESSPPPEGSRDRSSIKSQPPGYSFRTERYDLFQVIFVSSGELFFAPEPEKETKAETDARPLTGPTPTDATRLLPGSVLVLRHGSAFTLSSPSTGYGGVCYLDYGPGTAAQTGDSFAFRGGHWLVELVGLLQSALSNPEVYGASTLAALGRSIALHALDEGSRPSPNGAEDRSVEWSDRVKHLVQSTLYGGNRELKEKLESLGLSYRQLSRHFDRATGLSIKQYQLAEKIREAKRLLLNTGLGITDVAYELHYASSQKFAAHFRQATGMTPSEYRSLS